MAAISLESRVDFAVCIKNCANDVEEIQAVFLDADGTENDKKSILEQAFRDVLHEMLLSPDRDTCKLTDLVLLAIASAKSDITNFTVPFILLSDILDCLTLDICEEIFGFIEKQVSTWALADFYSSGKILLLRMCNDLLRRLSSTQNTVFCGRIQLFLSRLFPLSEKSALNLMSHFNLENVTAYNKEAGRNESGEASISMLSSDVMDIDNEEDSGEQTTPIDYNLYQKLWALQDVFRNPSQIFTSDQWKSVTTNIKDVLQAFFSYKLEDTSSSKISRKNRSEPRSRVMSTSEYKESHYFAKFLTSEKLMNLQLHDSHFRRHILIQLLILFQYLVGDVKFKIPGQRISDAQSLWIKDTTEQIYKLLAETPPNGSHFAEYIKQALDREESWIAWKNDGCPSYEKPPLKESEMKPFAVKKHLGDLVTPGNGGQIDMGSEELSRLWNLCPNNIEACKVKSRIFVPEVKKFLEEPIEQADPEARVEPEYKLVNKPNFTWQALRLLSQSSGHFFQNTTAQIKQLPDYLEHVIVQTGKDLQVGSDSSK